MLATATAPGHVFDLSHQCVSLLQHQPRVSGFFKATRARITLVPLGVCRRARIPDLTEGRPIRTGDLACESGSSRSTRSVVFFEFTLMTKGKPMEVNGMAHVILTASNFERSREFYRKLLPFLGLQPMIDSDELYYCVGGRTALGIRKPAPEHAGAIFDQSRVGLHHLCFRARERADIDELHGFLCSLDVKIIRAPREDQWAPGYYSLLFEDPDGMRLELNHVPGKGLLV
jgi:catechol 2,3-dioxygenase-like lactoylglutathione lyase family enzyme